MDELIGTQIGGCEIQSLIGKGGMGSVYKGMQISLKRPIALKILSSAVKDNKEYIDRFSREAMTIAKINHPNIIQIYDTGKKGDTYYIIMEYIDGQALSRMIEAQGSLSIPETLDIIIQVVQGLDAAWQNKIVHRDIKPDNILIASDNKVKIADFGLAKGTSELETLTVTGQVMGTPAYMSPEQCRGEDTDFRTDMYSLGVTIYYMLTGKNVFTGNSIAEIIFKQINSPIPAVSDILQDSRGKEIDFVLRKCLAKDQSNRYTDYSVLLNNLEIIKKDGSLIDAETQQTVSVSTAPSKQAGKYSCPQCNTSFDADPDFFNEVACSNCSFKFNPAEPSTQSFMKRGGSDIAEVPAPVSSGAYASTHSSRVISVQEEEHEMESLETMVRRRILFQPEEALVSLLSIINAMSKIPGGLNLILPENIIFHKDATVTISDCSSPYTSLSYEQAVFASPELCKDEKINESSRVYSLGMILIYMLSGKYSIENKNIAVIKDFHLESKSLNLCVMNPAVSETLDRIVTLMCGFGAIKRLESLSQAKELIENEIKRIDGAEVHDIVTDEEGLKACEEKPETPVKQEEGERLVDIQSYSGITCPQCNKWNPLINYVCEGCGKLFSQENPERAPETEKEYLNVVIALYDKGNYEIASMIVEEGLKKNFTSLNLKEIRGRIETALEVKIVGVIEEKAALFASEKKYRKAIREWKKAGVISQEAKTRNIEKIKWAKARSRKQKLIYVAVLLVIAIIAGGTIFFMYPEKVLNKAKNIIHKINLEISSLFDRFIKREKSKVDSSEFDSIEGVIESLEKAAGEDLSKQDRAAIPGLRTHLVELCSNAVGEIEYNEYVNLIDRGIALVKGTQQEHELKNLRKRSLDIFLADAFNRCTEKSDNNKVEEALQELKQLQKLAENTSFEGRIEGAIKDNEEKLIRTQYSTEIESVTVEFNRIRLIEKSGDYARALEEYKELQKAIQNERIYYELLDDVRYKISKISKYQEKAGVLLAKAEKRWDENDITGSSNLYERILKQYTHSTSVKHIRLPLNITTFPPGCSVMLNGNEKGASPYTLYLSPQSASKVKIYHEGYIPEEIPVSDIEYSFTDRWSLSVNLNRKPTRLIQLQERISGIGNIGAKFFSAALDSVICYYPLKDDKKITRKKYPESALSKSGTERISTVSNDYRFIIIKDTLIMEYDPLMDKVKMMGTVGSIPHHSLMLAKFGHHINNTGIFFWGVNDVLYCYDQNNLKQRWIREYDAEECNSYFICPYRDMIITGTGTSEDSSLAVLKKSNGDLAYTVPVPAGRIFPSIEGDIMYFCTDKGRLYAFDLKKNVEIWHTGINSASISTVPFVSDKSSVVVLSDEGMCYSFNKISGHLQWNKKLGIHPLKGGVFFENNIYIYDSYGTIYLLNTDGSLIDRFYGNGKVASKLLFYVDSLLYATENGNIVLFSL